MDIDKKCDFLHKLFNNMNVYKFQKSDIEKIKYKYGVYIVFEHGEIAHGGNRIVRVGINNGRDSTLAGRLLEHYENEGRSIFRKHIARCLLEIKTYDTKLKQLFHDSKYLKLVATWKKTINDNTLKEYYKLHGEISAYIRNRCSFIVFPVKQKDEGEDWERKIISTVFSCPICDPSENWFGKNFPKEIKSSYNKIFKSGLWNVEHVNDKHILEDEELNNLYNIVNNT